MPSPRVAVRDADPGDIDDLWPLVRDFATSFEPARADFEATFPRLLARRHDTALLVAGVPDAPVVGYLLASTHPTFLANGPVAWVEELMVDSRRRRLGIGRELMTAAEGWAFSRGAAYVSLASRRAADFYSAIGYDESATFFRKMRTG